MQTCFRFALRGYSGRNASAQGLFGGEGVGIVEPECKGSFREGVGAVHLIEEEGVGIFHAYDAVVDLGVEESGDGFLASEV